MSSMRKNIVGKTIKARKGLKIGIVRSEYNAEIVEALHKNCIHTLLQSGVAEKNIKSVQVPGAFELPLACQKMAEGNKVHAVIALGAVIRGETPHFDYVAGSCAQGIMDVNLATGTPIIFGVLTTDNLAEAKARSSKGTEAALAAVSMTQLDVKLGNNAET